MMAVELAVKEAMDLSEDRLHGDEDDSSDIKMWP